MNELRTLQEHVDKETPGPEALDAFLDVAGTAFQTGQAYRANCRAVIHGDAEPSTIDSRQFEEWDEWALGMLSFFALPAEARAQITGGKVSSSATAALAGPAAGETGPMRVIDLVTEVGTEVHRLLHGPPDRSCSNLIPAESRQARILSAGLFIVIDRDPADLSKDNFRIANTSARLGFLTRFVEYQRFRDPSVNDSHWQDLVVKELQRRIEDDDDIEEALAQFAAALVRAEPLDPVGKDASVPSWYVPGMGADIRGVFRDVTLKNVVTLDREQILVGPLGPIHGLSMEEIGSIWKFGFFYRAIEDELEAAHESGPN